MSTFTKHGNKVTKHVYILQSLWELPLGPWSKDHRKQQNKRQQHVMGNEHMEEEDGEGMQS